MHLSCPRTSEDFISCARKESELLGAGTYQALATRVLWLCKGVV